MIKYNIHQEIKNIVVLIIGSILTFVAGCKKDINGPPIKESRDYLEYGNVVKEGLIAYYPFDGNAKDYSGNEYNGVENGPFASVGRFGQQEGALKFNGIDDYIEIPNFYKIDGNSGTICFWVRTQGTLNEYKEAAVISKIDTVGFGYALSVTFSDFRFTYKILHFKAEEAMQGSYLGAGKYLFLAVTFSNNKYDYYFQGEPAGGGSFEPAEIFRFNDNKQPLFIGKSLISQYEFFEGEIDDLLIYNRALSNDEIMKLYNWK